MNREARNLLPDKKEEHFVSIINEGIRDRDRIKKEGIKEYTDRKRRARETSIEKDDVVLMQNKRTDKLTTNFGQTEFKIVKQIEKKSLIKDPNGKKYVRCTSELKKVTPRNETRQNTSRSHY